MSDGNEEYAWMDDESHADLASHLAEAYEDQKKLREAFKMVENGLEHVGRWAIPVDRDNDQMDLNPAGDYVEYDDLRKLIAAAKAVAA